jgi:hypothetical protein
MTCTQHSGLKPYLAPNMEPFHATESKPEQVAFWPMTPMLPAAPAETPLVAMATWLDQTRTSPAIGACPDVLAPYWP